MQGQAAEVWMCECGVADNIGFDSVIYSKQTTGFFVVIWLVAVPEIERDLSDFKEATSLW